MKDQLNKTRYHKMIIRAIRKVNPGLVALLGVTVLLGLLNWLTVNQKVVLYLFYLPVVVAAWTLSRREAIEVAVLAALMVIAYMLVLPSEVTTYASKGLFWAELVVWGGVLVLTALLISTLQERTRQSTANLQRAYKGVLCILTKFIQSVDTDTEAHSIRVAAWAVRIGREMHLDDRMIEEIRIAGILHDVGKVDVGVDILRKAASLSNEEVARIRDHTTHGAKIVKPLGGMLAEIADAIEAHHEKYDGSGYRNLQAEEIPFVSRILAVADAFDALLSDRSYRKGVGIHEAINQIIACAGTHFDPRIVVALQKITNREGEEALARTLSSQASLGEQAPSYEKIDECAG